MFCAFLAQKDVLNTYVLFPGFWLLSLSTNELGFEYLKIYKIATDVLSLSPLQKFELNIYVFSASVSNTRIRCIYPVLWLLAPSTLYK
jgi:hypothetical protein